MTYSPPDTLFDHVEGVILVAILCGYALAIIVRVLCRSRPEFQVRGPLVACFGLRFAAIAGISASTLAGTLQGGDEIGFLASARSIAAAPFSSSAWAPGVNPLHEIVFALQMRLGDFSESAMRITQVAIATCGLLLLATAVHDLAGPRAGRLALWLVAVEPSSIFFNQLLHKEPLMELASGLIALGGVHAWRRVDLRALTILASGSALAIFTRPYAGWFLTSAAVLIVLHATARDATKSLSAAAVLACVLVGIAAAVPVILQVTSNANLKAGLQTSQDANTTLAQRGNGGPNGNNLALESVDYSTRGAVITNLPIRMRDLLLRPYPWQVANASEQLGVLGTLVAYAILVALVRYGVRARRELVRLVGPLLYPLAFLLVAYSLSTGNAGTGFRYRSHLVTLGLAIAVVLHEHCLAAGLESVPGRGGGRSRRQGREGGFPWRPPRRGSHSTRVA